MSLSIYNLSPWCFRSLYIFLLLSEFVSIEAHSNYAMHGFFYVRSMRQQRLFLFFSFIGICLLLSMNPALLFFSYNFTPTNLRRHLLINVCSLFVIVLVFYKNLNHTSVLIWRYGVKYSKFGARLDFFSPFPFAVRASLGFCIVILISICFRIICLQCCLNMYRTQPLEVSVHRGIFG